MGWDTTSKRWMHHMKGKGKKRLQVAIVGRPTYTPVKAPNAVLASSLCANPMLPLAGTLAIF